MSISQINIPAMIQLKAHYYLNSSQIIVRSALTLKVYMTHDLR